MEWTARAQGLPALAPVPARASKPARQPEGFRAQADGVRFPRPRPPFPKVFMHPNEQTLEKFYSAFARLDPDSMAQCYAADASFDDEVFSLRGHEQVTGMWH